MAQVRRLLPKKTKIGHTGTLDPMASGLLVLLIGRATRLSRYVMEMEKTYTATARFGAVSDTLDAEGEITDLEASLPSEEALRSALSAFTGDLMQVPPMASALKQKGIRLYELHRRGTSVQREARPVRIQSLKLLSIDPSTHSATFEISCSSGTYVRTLIADLAASLASGAYLTALRRTSVGHLSLDAVPHHPHDIHNRIIPPAEIVSHLPALDTGVRRVEVCNGRPLEDIGIEGSFRVMDRDELLAVYRGEGRESRAEVVLCAG